jgi:PHS family inorganic phosphate transporter-like MFS transporter
MASGKYLGVHALQDDDASPPPKRKSNFIGAMGNFSVQYNMQCLSIALAFMKTKSDDVLPSSKASEADYPEPDWAVKSLLAMVFTGSVVGMGTMGYIGDIFGRRIGMIMTLSFVVFGSLASAFLSWGNTDSVYGVITVCRFLIGFGVGGIYPMAAATAAEGSSKGENDGERVGWAFFWQAPGAMAPYVVAYFLQFMSPDTPNVTSIQFRTLLALGAVPATIVLVATYLSASDTPKATSTPAGFLAANPGSSTGSGKKNPFKEAMEHPKYLRTLIGTGGTWFLYDVAYYGTSIFTPQILKGIFGAQDSLADLCWQSLAVSSMGIPALITSIWLIRRIGGRGLNLWGFLIIAVFFAVLAGLYMQSNTGLPNEKFAVFCLLTFALNWGVQVGTYVTPAMAYPPEVRTTFHGLSAASGKLGAVAGTIIFSLSPVNEPAVFIIIMWFLVAVSLLGAVVTYLYVPDLSDEGRRKAGELEGVDKESLLRDSDDPEGSRY